LERTIGIATRSELDVGPKQSRCVRGVSLERDIQSLHLGLVLSIDTDVIIAVAIFGKRTEISGVRVFILER